ncbi:MULTISPECIES: hypothetical protein [unclassified Streptomyces]|uniref:hypothetical protein n=1 Tax=unclassified Streptomyces TaxID=2593676 RepID=UPI000CD53670|nr:MULTISPECIES: hypothetical protein [unclassified Streptomyces]AWL38247.1 hypothetical protein B9S64_09025 [Streptomyces sp. SM18]
MAAARDEAIKIQSYPNEQEILDRIVNGRYTAQEVLLLLSLIENQFVAERIRRSPISTTRSTIWLGNTELGAVERQLRRLIVKITGHLSRQHEDLRGDPDSLNDPLRGLGKQRPQK